MFTAFDIGFAVLVLISAVLAAARGLTREVLSLVTWAGSAAIAAYMYFKHPEIARGYVKDPLVADVATVAISFIVSLIVLHLITMRIADFVVESRVGALDRTLGFVFGAVRGVLIGVVVVIFGLWLFPDANKLPDWVEGSKSLHYLQNFGDELIAALPQNLEEQITNLLKHNKTGTPTAGEDNGTTDDTGGDDTGDAGGADNAAPDSGATAAPDGSGAAAAPDVTTAPPVSGSPAAPVAPAPAAPAGSGA